jgi:hypothetical protein
MLARQALDSARFVSKIRFRASHPNPLPHRVFPPISPHPVCLKKISPPHVPIGPAPHHGIEGPPAGADRADIRHLARSVSGDGDRPVVGCAEIAQLGEIWPTTGGPGLEEAGEPGCLPHLGDGFREFVGLWLKAWGGLFAPVRAAGGLLHRCRGRDHVAALLGMVRLFRRGVPVPLRETVISPAPQENVFVLRRNII